jgi:cytochrome c
MSAAARRLFASCLLAAGLCACAPPGAAPSPAAAKAALADLPPRFQAADLKNGEALLTLCRACHTVVAGGADLQGPNLHGVFGRVAGSKPGYAYSDAVKGYAQPWTAERLDRWLANPKTFLPGTKMGFGGLAKPDDRRDVIAYLKVVSTAP